MRGKAALGLLALALMFRVLIPVGWMPTTGSGFAITLCTGMGAVTAWVDKDGRTHKEKPAQEPTGHPCTFSGFSATLDLPDLGAAFVAPRPVETALLITRIAEVAIGRGLAAPPPPPTGPPANL
jgi:hypothetical protein